MTAVPCWQREVEEEKEEEAAEERAMETQVRLCASSHGRGAGSIATMRAAAWRET
jgi:hypothetical protein